MNITFKNYNQNYLSEMTKTWNDIIEEGVAFPGEELYTPEEFEKMLFEQSTVTCMFYDDRYAGYYIIHPNNIGRCSHVANASYCIDRSARGAGGFSQLVKNSLVEATDLGFKGMQFNAVVASNLAAIHTYQKNDFSIIGTIPKGFRLKDQTFSDMYVMYRAL